MVASLEGLDGLKRRWGLTARELQILVLLGQGFRAREISHALFISELTARTHIHHIYEKTNAKNRVELSKVLGSMG